MLFEIVRQQDPRIIACPPRSVGVIIPAHPATARELFAAHPDVVAAICGPMGSFCPGEPHDYASARCGKPDVLMYDRRTRVSVPGIDARRDQGITISIRNGLASAARRRQPVDGAEVAFQLYPGLVEDGEVAVRERPADHADSRADHRLAVALLTDGRIGLVYSHTSMIGLARQLAGLGIRWAGYTDGGGSSSLVWKDGAGVLHGSDDDDPGGRRLFSFIVVRPAPVALRLVDRMRTPAGRLATVATAGLMGVGIWLATREG